MSMTDVYIGEGGMAGKGVYAARPFKKGEIVIQYHLRPITREEYDALSFAEQQFTHEHWGQIYLYEEPERYVNHADTPNTLPDLRLRCDIATREIAKGEMITTDATQDDI